MKIWDYFIGLGIATIFVSILFMFENQKIKAIPILSDPLIGEKLLNKNFELDEDKKFKNVFTNFGSFLRIFPSTKIDFLEDKKNLILRKGEVFVVGGTHNYESPIYLYLENFKINLSENMFFVKLDENNKFFKIITFSGLTYLIRPDGKHIPIPVGYTFFLDVKNFNKNSTTPLYKIVESDTLSIFDDTDDDYDKISEAISYYLNWYNKFREYAIKSPLLWGNYIENNISTTLKNFRQKYILNYQGKWSDEWSFQKMTHNLINLSKIIEKNEGEITNENLQKSLEFIKKHKKLAKTVEYKNFFANNENYNKILNNFIWTQKIWLSNDDDDDISRIFINLWTDEKTLNENFKGKTLQKLSLIQHFLFQKNFNKVDKYLQEFLLMLNSQEYSTDEDLRILQLLRRELFLLFDIESKIISPSNIDVLTKITELELSLRKNDQTFDYVYDEIGYQIIKYMDMFLEEKPNKKIMTSLVNWWQVFVKKSDEFNFNIDKYKNKNTIKLAKKSAIVDASLEKIKKILEEEEEQKILENAILESEINTEQNNNSDDVSDNEITTPKNFLNFMNKNEIKINLLNFSTNPEFGTTTFSKAIYLIDEDKVWVSGEFEYSSHFFKKFKINETEYLNIHINSLENILQKFKAEYKKQKELEKNDNKEWEAINIREKYEVSQNTKLAILSKQLVRNLLLKDFDLQVEKVNIQIIDKDSNKFKIWLAIPKHNSDLISLNFVFDKAESSFETIFGKKNNQEVPEFILNEGFTKDDFLQFLEENKIIEEENEIIEKEKDSS